MTIPDIYAPKIATVRVPGSTSNFGSGFDCVGMAVDLWLTVTCEVAHVDRAMSFTRTGTVSHLKMEPFQDLIATGFTIAAGRRGHELPDNAKFTVHSDIPVARGLGSSTAAMAAGAAIADLMFDLHMGCEGVAQMVAQIEEHPDNALPAVYGGVMLGVARDDATPSRPCTYHFSKVPLHEKWAFVFAIPPFEIKTVEARAALPEEIEFSRGVTAVQRSAALMHGLITGDWHNVARGLTDVLHVPYRRTMIPGYDAIVKAAIDGGAVGATLSGSGSTLMAVCHVEDTAEVGDAMADAFAHRGIDAAVHVSHGNVRGMEVLESPTDGPTKLYRPWFS